MLNPILKCMYPSFVALVLVGCKADNRDDSSVITSSHRSESNSISSSVSSSSSSNIVISVSSVANVSSIQSSSIACNVEHPNVYADRTPFIESYYTGKFIKNRDQTLVEMPISEIEQGLKNALKRDVAENFYGYLTYNLENGFRKDLWIPANQFHWLSYNWDTRLANSAQNNANAYIAKASVIDGNYRYHLDGINNDSTSVSSSSSAPNLGEPTAIIQRSLENDATQILFKLPRIATDHPDLVPLNSDQGILLSVFNVLEPERIAEWDVKPVYYPEYNALAVHWTDISNITDETINPTPMFDGNLIYTVVSNNFAYILHSPRIQPKDGVFEKYDIYSETSVLQNNNDIIENFKVQDLFTFQNPTQTCWSYSGMPSNEVIDDVLLITSVDLTSRETSTQCVAGVFTHAFMTGNGLYLRDNIGTEEALEDSWQFIRFNKSNIEYVGSIQSPAGLQYRERFAPL